MNRRLLIGLVTAALLGACGGERETDTGTVRTVQIGAASLREISETIDGFGSLSFLTKIDISAPQDALIRRLYFREGDMLRRGELAVLLDNPQLRLAAGRAENALAQAEAARDLAAARLLEGEFQAEAQFLSLVRAGEELAQARRIYEEDLRKHQAQELIFEAGGLSDEAIREKRFVLESELEQLRLMERDLEIRQVGSRDRDLAAAGMAVPPEAENRVPLYIRLQTASLRAELNAAEARLEAAAKELESARLAESELAIISPGTGIVGARYLEEGERVKREDRLLTLMDTSSLYAIFSVRESEALRLEKGMAAEVEIGGTGKVYAGTVDLVYPQADSQSLSFLVRVLLKGGEQGGLQELKPGMFARVSVLLEKRPALVVPESSLTHKKEDEALVFVVKGNHVSPRKLSLGPLRETEREVLSGINAGEVLVLRPGADLREGEYVHIAE
jgi:multidrug efflux pump subunit AcrA (membrane-fusion protein)